MTRIYKTRFANNKKMKETILTFSADLVLLRQQIMDKMAWSTASTTQNTKGLFVWFLGFIAFQVNASVL